MKSILIKDTTKQERIEIIREWLPVDDGLEDCEIDLWDMYDAYIKGEKEIAEINNIKAQLSNNDKLTLEDHVKALILSLLSNISLFPSIVF
jgi:hypothetical protein